MNQLELASKVFEGKVQCDGTRMPFMVGDLDPTKGFVHVLDDTSLEVLMRARDTIADFVAYLIKKEAFSRSGRLLFAPGEDDLVAYYLQSVDDEGEFDFVIPPEVDGLICIAEGEWEALEASKEWKAREQANQVSYVWDKIIERFSTHIIDGTSPAYPEFPLQRQELAVRALARENRLVRRVLATALGDFLRKPNPPKLSVRVVAPPRPECPYYLFLSLAPDSLDQDNHRKARRGVMNAYCLAMKLKYPDAREIVAIATEPTGSSGPSSEDVMFCDVSELTPEQEADARDIQDKLGFLTKLSEPFRAKAPEYPIPSPTMFAHQPGSLAMRRRSQGRRNSPCSCGSGRKFKACCFRQIPG